MQLFNQMAGNPFGSFLDPQTAMQNMTEAGSFAQMALRAPELTADMLAAQGVPPPPAAQPNLGALVNGKKAPDAVDNLTKALGALQPEPPQAPLAPPAAVAPRAGGQVDSANIMRMLQLMSAPQASIGRIPSLGALVAGR